MNATDNTTQAADHAETSNESHTSDSTGARTFGGSMPLRRPVHDRMLAGVASGIADYLGVDETLVRIAIVVATFFGGVGIAIYLAGWLLIPDEGSDQSIASELLQSISTRSR
jgi:phage shock protein PspC (stress-responsive transcriptional regulator)